MTAKTSTARRMWWLLEPIHAVLYYAPVAFDHAHRLGYPVAQRWPSYFAWRAAPLGAIDAPTATAAFHSFNPHMVAQHIPAAWHIATPHQVLAARLSAVGEFYRDTPAQLSTAAALARRAAEAADTHHRPLAAANAAQPWPTEAHLVLWQAATILREHRGDGHLTALREHDLGPLESLVSFAAVGAAPPEVFASRGWSQQQWDQASQRLRARGLIDASGQATDAGHQLRAAVEHRTDELAAAPWRALGADTTTLAALLRPVLDTVLSAGVLPRQSTLGIGLRPQPPQVTNR
ncbi:hypothetical protein ABT324_19850 [Saccharopolyspora sp. NPDC000359]|uniref:SCO6745 family protein n=1 Tax=Saccharopolyspora sp. NPDC000359 TaxID=3154251 RepID=UPI0033182A89